MEMHNPAHPGEIVREECLKLSALPLLRRPRRSVSRAKHYPTY
jgi:plasmid maintenance system antidote protein VapI